jgi:hypothetical protein
MSKKSNVKYLGTTKIFGHWPKLSTNIGALAFFFLCVLPLFSLGLHIISLLLFLLKNF